MVKFRWSKMSKKNFEGVKKDKARGGQVLQFNSSAGSKRWYWAWAWA